MNGIVLIDKPAGPTSHDVVACLRGHLGIRRIGHAGTLDPFATGLLVCLVGQATKLSQFVVGHRKTYCVQAVFNDMTDTYDRTGCIISHSDRVVTASELAAAVEDFPKRYDQTPPPYSAKKIKGTPAHKLVRQGAQPILSPKTVEIYRLSITRCDLPRVELIAEVSSGTYIRSLIVDLAGRLGTVAHVAELRRLTCGPFDVRDAVTLADMPALGPARAPARLLAMGLALTDMPTIELSDEDATAFANGRCLRAGGPCGLVAVTCADALVGVARRDAAGLKVVRVIHR